MIICPWKELRKYAPLLPGLEEAVAAVNALESLEPGTYPLENGRFMVQAGTTSPLAEATLEAHREYLDIQYLVKGGETVGWAPVDTLTPREAFNTQKDIGFYTGHCDPMVIAPGYCYVVFPEDAHAPGSHLDEPNEYVKIIIKLKV